ncbi:hypothetical protein [Corynebacterium epidermidicanis]|uniref:Beta-lactamase enzyme family n=1 Tax=Corynebacterium epidermidicanis TaxID=1050174 RepID=A0A0G3GPE6_9CORY|nr:hypothetical protein [Corynebacterium epidermidicanis]AKK02450.1 hypothetical protein CEPID_02850 [Corynebacterium epidermidicanis]
MKRVVIGTVACALALSTTPAQAYAPPPRTEVSVRDAGGANFSWNSQVAPALSLIKLPLGYWVLYHGSDEDKALVEPMIQRSDDGIATYLNQKYPSAIGDVVRDLGMMETEVAPFWGNCRMSMADVTYFLHRTASDPVAEPLRQGMRQAAPIAADGNPQNYGTATLPGVEGTKFGWSDDRKSMNATASFGPGFTVAARTIGPAEQLTADVQGVSLPGKAPAPWPGAPVPGAPQPAAPNLFGSVEIPGVALPVIPLPTLPPLSPAPLSSY